MLQNKKNGNLIPMESDLRKYKFAVGDNFEIDIRNENTTIASMLFSTLTGRKSDYGTPRIYIKYGGVIRNEVIQTILTEAYAEGEEEIDVNNASSSSGKIQNLSPEIGKEYNFAYLGKEEKITLKPGTYRIIATGAQGGGATDKDIQGGLGGKVEGLIKLTEETMLTINVGSKGKDASNKYSSKIDTDTSKDNIKSTGGYNGGGNSTGVAGAGGGGATEVKLSNNQILLVAAGGGGNTYSNLDTYKNISAGGNTDIENLTETKEGESACINRHISSYQNDEAGGGAGYRGGKVIHGDNTRCSYGGSNYINSKLFMSNSLTAGVSQGNGSVKIIRVN